MINERPLSSKKIHNFKVVTKVKPIEGARDIRTISGKQQGDFKKSFEIYSNPYEYLINISKYINIEKNDSYKYFVKIEYTVLNQYGFPVSGGDMAEFNLIQEPDDAKYYYLLLIDEPESSFDNIFLKDGVNRMIRDISENMPVIIATHNNVIGASILPDYFIYTERVVDGENKKKIIIFIQGFQQVTS